MSILVNTVISALGTYAFIKWWFDTDLKDYLTTFFSQGEYQTWIEFQDQLMESKGFPKFLGEVTMCAWCMAFHISFFSNLMIAIAQGEISWVILPNIPAASGAAMLLWQLDLKE